MQRPCHNPAMVAIVAAIALTSILDAAPDILISRQLAARTHLNVGDIVTVATSPTGGRLSRFRVAGVYEPTPDPMRFTAQRIEARMHLPDLVALAVDPDQPAARDVVDEINVKLAKPADAVRFGHAL